MWGENPHLYKRKAKMHDIEMNELIKGLEEKVNECTNLKKQDAKLCYYYEVPDEYKGMLYWEEYEDNGGFFYDLDDLYERCEARGIPLPDYVWGTQTDMIHIDADYIVEAACEELHEDAYESIDHRDMKELQKMLDDWCNEQTGTVTYYPDYTYAIRVRRD